MAPPPTPSPGRRSPTWATRRPSPTRGSTSRRREHLWLTLVVAGALLGGACDDGQDVSTDRQRDGTTTTALPTGVFPVGADRLGGAGLVLFDADHLVLAAFDGTEISRLPRGDWYVNRPERGVDLNPVPGGVTAVEAPAVDDSIPGCKDVQPGPDERDFERAPTSGYRRGGARAAVCWPEPDQPSEVHLVAPDGSTTKLAAPLDRTGRWKYALPSPDGRRLLTQWSQTCDQRAIVISVPDGAQSTVGTRAIGWAPDGRAVVGLGPSCPDTAGAATAPRGTVLVDPATGAQQKISDLAAGALVAVVDGGGLSRLERRLALTLDDAGLPRTATGTIFDGAEVAVTVAPAGDAARPPGDGALAFTCGGAHYTLAGAGAEVLERLATLLAARLVCLRVP